VPYSRAPSSDTRTRCKIVHARPNWVASFTSCEDQSRECGGECDVSRSASSRDPGFALDTLTIWLLRHHPHIHDYAGRITDKVVALDRKPGTPYGTRVSHRLRPVVDVYLYPPIVDYDKQLYSQPLQQRTKENRRVIKITYCITTTSSQVNTFNTHRPCWSLL
jgi:hypothetical protein